MTRLRAFSVVLITLVAGCGPRTPEAHFIESAAAALGARDRVLAVRTIAFEGEGRQFNLGQDMRPGASGQTFAVTALKRQIDVMGRRSRTELTRTPNFLYFQGPSPQRQVQGVDGEIGYNVSAGGTASRVAASVAGDRRADFYHYPITIVVAALAPRATVANVREEGSERVAEITTEEGVQLTLAIDTVGLPTRVESRSYHPNLGDVTLSTHFGDYQEIDGVRVPTRVVMRTDDFTTAELRFTNNRINGTIDDLAAPAAASTASPPLPAPANVVAEQVADGVWLLAGQSHHSALVELSDRLLLIEAPQSEARTLAVIAKARELYPQKSLTDLVVTHHHFDHTAGLRAAVAEGLKVITHEGNRAFVEEMAGRPHTIVVDALARRRRPAVIQTVSDELLIEDALRTVAIYHVAENPHSDTMLMVHLPAERLLVEVDAFSPGAQVNPYAANLYDNIMRRRLRVERIVPLHGAVVPFTELAKLRRSDTS